MTNSKYLDIFCVILLALVLRVEAVHTVQDINKLSAELLSGYNKNTLPSANFDQQFQLGISVGLVALGDIDEVEERLSTVMMFIFTWNDTSLRWNATDHNNITNITVSWTDVWKPVVMVVNPHQDASKQHSEINSDTIGFSDTGEAFLLELVTFQTTCDLDTTYFPFDIQTCSMSFYISENDAYFIKIHASWNNYGKSFTKENGAWKLISKEIKGDDFSRFKISLKMKRKPLFMLVNILLPIIVLALLAPLVFLMPKNSGERVGYSITMLLALSVYMTIISDNLPKNSDPMPLVSIMIFIWYIMNSSIVFVVITNTKINHIKDGREVPRLARTFVILTRKIKGVKRLHVGDTPEEEILNSLSNGSSQDEDDEENSAKPMKRKSQPHLEKSDNYYRARYPDGVTWQELSVAIDKWGVVLSYVIKISIPVVFFTIMKTQSN